MRKILLLVNLLIVAGLLGPTGNADDLRGNNATHQAILMAQSEAADDKTQPKTDGKKEAAEEEPDC